MHYWICPRCGAYLDAGEKCDCKDLIKVRESKRKEVKKCQKKEQKPISISA